MSRPDQPVQGVAWMIVTGLLFVAVTAVVRFLGTDMSATQAAFIRYAFGALITIPVLARTALAGIRPTRPGLYALRGLLHAAGVMLWFFAMARIPVAEVTAIGFTSPLFMTIGAALFLGEKLRARRIGAVLFGFFGTLIILRPGFAVVEVGALAQLLAAPLFAGSYLLAKKLTQTESSVTIVAYLSLTVMLALAPGAYLAWRTPSVEELALLFLTALLATAGHYTLTRALNCTQLTLLQPFAFLQLVWATLVGLYFFAEHPDIWTWVGGAVIVASATYIAHREMLRTDPKPVRESS